MFHHSMLTLPSTTTDPNARPLIAFDSRICPACGAHALESFVSLSVATQPGARRVETRGLNTGRAYHVAAECTACGASFEVRA